MPRGGMLIAHYTLLSYTRVTGAIAARVKVRPFYPRADRGINFSLPGHA